MTVLEETDHPSFPLPTNKDMPVWRYMDLAKYLSMLDSKCLYFARATTFKGDSFEGSLPKRMVQALEDIRANRPDHPHRESLMELGQPSKTVRDTFFVSCWHMQEHESAAMWKIYADSDQAVCICSTYRRLRLALRQCIKIGEVTYIDYDEDKFLLGFPHTQIMHKRLPYKYERELRAIFWQLDSSTSAKPYKDRIESGGLAIEVDLPALIERVHVSPTAPLWFAKVVEAMTRKCGFDFAVKPSALAAAPLW